MRARSTWIAAGALFLGLCVALGLAWSLSARLAVPGPGSPMAEQTEQPERSVAPPPERPRVQVPRPPPRTPALAPDSPPTPSPSDTDSGADTDGGPSDPEADSDMPDFPSVIAPDGPALGRALTAALQEVQPEMIDCLQGWNVHEAGGFEGEVVFSFAFTPEGVDDIGLLDVERVPEETLRCLGDVLWDDVDWPATDGPVEVTWPIKVSVRPDEPQAEEEGAPEE